MEKAYRRGIAWAYQGGQEQVSTKALSQGDVEDDNKDDDNDKVTNKCVPQNFPQYLSLWKGGLKKKSFFFPALLVILFSFP